MRVAAVATRYSLLSLLVAPAALAFVVLRADVVSASTVLTRVRDYGFAYLFALLSFGLGLLAAGALSGLLVAAVARRSRGVRASVGLIAPAILLPVSVVASFFAFSTGIPLIQNGDPYVIAGAVGGVLVGLLALKTAQEQSGA